MQYGYMGRLLYVDLTKGETSEKEIPAELARQYIGGSGLGARLLFDSTDAVTEPFGEDNVLMFLTGPLVETLVPMAGRFAVVAKSALGIWGEGDCGGNWGSMLKRSGYDGVVITGKASHPVYLWISEGRAWVRDARHIWGRDTVDTDALVKQETSDKAVVASIGPAGEELVRMAVVITDGRHARASGRGGLGAIMGSKLLKAIAVFGTKRPNVAHPEELKDFVRQWVPRVRAASTRLSNYGTAGAVIVNSETGDMPVKNWSLGKWEEEKVRRVSGQAMADSILTKRYHCKGCVIGCGRVVNITEGTYAGVSGGGPEYETMGSLGTLCLIDDLNAVAKGNELCNRYGMDTISAGSAIAFAMEAYEKGLIDRNDTGGIELAWGNAGAMISMIHKLGRREGIGRLLGEGVKAASRALGTDSENMTAEVKGLELAMHDPRALGSLAVAYATYPRGACHRGCSYTLERIGIPELGYDKPMERQSDEGKAIMVAKMQDYAGLFNSLKMCQLVMYSTKPSEIVQCLNYVTGWDMDLDELLRAGERASCVKRAYNVRLGLTRKDDTLPARIRTLKFEEGGAANYLPDLEAMLDEFYRYRGWSKDGIPLPSKLRGLGLHTEAEMVVRMYPLLAGS